MAVALWFGPDECERQIHHDAGGSTPLVPTAPRATSDLLEVNWSSLSMTLPATVQLPLQRTPSSDQSPTRLFFHVQSFEFETPRLHSVKTSEECDFDTVFKEALTQVDSVRDAAAALTKRNCFYYRFTGSSGTGKTRVALELATRLRDALLGTDRGGVLVTYYALRGGKPLSDAQVRNAKISDAILRDVLTTAHFSGGTEYAAPATLDDVLQLWCSSPGGTPDAAARRRVWVLVLDEYQRDPLRTRAMLLRLSDRMFTDSSRSGGADLNPHRLVVLPIVCGLSPLGLDQDPELRALGGSGFLPRPYSLLPLPEESGARLWEQVWRDPSHPFAQPTDPNDCQTLRAALGGWPRGYDALLSALRALQSTEKFAAASNTHTPARTSTAITIGRAPAATSFTSASASASSSSSSAAASSCSGSSGSGSSAAMVVPKRATFGAHVYPSLLSYARDAVTGVHELGNDNVLRLMLIALSGALVPTDFRVNGDIVEAEESSGWFSLAKDPIRARQEVKGLRSDLRRVDMPFLAVDALGGTVKPPLDLRVGPYKTGVVWMKLEHVSVFSLLLHSAVSRLALQTSPLFQHAFRSHPGMIPFARLRPGVALQPALAVLPVVPIPGFRSGKGTGGPLTALGSELFVFDREANTTRMIHSLLQVTRADTGRPAFVDPNADTDSDAEAESGSDGDGDGGMIAAATINGYRLRPGVYTTPNEPGLDAVGLLLCPCADVIKLPQTLQPTARASAAASTPPKYGVVLWGSQSRARDRANAQTEISIPLLEAIETKFLRPLAQRLANDLQCPVLPVAEVFSTRPLPSSKAERKDGGQTKSVPALNRTNWILVHRENYDLVLSPSVRAHLRPLREAGERAGVVSASAASAASVKEAESDGIAAAAADVPTPEPATKRRKHAASTLAPSPADSVTAAPIAAPPSATTVGGRGKRKRADALDLK